MMHFNGNTRSSKHPVREFRCLHGKKYQGDLVERSKKVYREFSMHNDKKMNTRGQKGKNVQETYCHKTYLQRQIMPV